MGSAVGTIILKAMRIYYLQAYFAWHTQHGLYIFQFGYYPYVVENVLEYNMQATLQYQLSNAYG